MWNKKGELGSYESSFHIRSEDGCNAITFCEELGRLEIGWLLILFFGTFFSVKLINWKVAR